MFDGVSLSDHAFQSPALPNIPLRQPSPGSSSSNADRHLEPPQTYDGLLQANSALKTRVNELEVINGLYQGHVRQYQQDQQPPAPQAEMIPQDSSDEASLRQLLQQSQQREEDLNRRLEELERELAEARGRSLPPQSGRGLLLRRGVRVSRPARLYDLNERLAYSGRMRFAKSYSAWYHGA